MGRGQQAWPPEQGVRRATALFRRSFDGEPDGVWAAPGRVNLIGEHTDYNAGLCLPIALPHATYVALRPRDDGVARLVTGHRSPSTWQGTVAAIAPGRVKGWAAYCAGPAWALRQDGYDIPGFDAAIASCVPNGAGLSSSAAVECAMALGLADLVGRPAEDDAHRAALADACRRAENEVAGAPTGGLDQSASLRTAADTAILLDCRDGSVTPVPLPLAAAGMALLVIDTRATHKLVDGQYAARREACEEAARRLDVPALREVTDLDRALAALPEEELRRRVRHVVTEIERVREVVSAIGDQAWERMGKLMSASHASLRDDYEVSCAELDAAVAASLDAGALGARMTGGGFGGSAVALVWETSCEAVEDAVLAAARAAGLAAPVLHRVTPSAAGSRVA